MLPKNGSSIRGGPDSRPAVACRTIAGPHRRRVLLSLSIDFADAGRFHNGRTPLPIRKMLRAFAIDVNAGELFAVVIVDSHLPVAMLAPPVTVEGSAFFACHQGSPQKSGETILQFQRTDASGISGGNKLGSDPFRLSRAASCRDGTARSPEWTATQSPAEWPSSTCPEISGLTRLLRGWRLHRLSRQ